MCFYGKKMAFCSASGLRSQIFRCAQNDRDRQQNNCQEYYFSLVKKSKNTFCHPPSSQGWSDLNPKIIQTYLPIDAQQLIHSFKILVYFRPKEKLRPYTRFSCGQFCIFMQSDCIIMHFTRFQSRPLLSVCTPSIARVHTL